MKPVGTMSKEEKNFNKNDLEGYKDYDQNQYAMVVGLRQKNPGASKRDNKTLETFTYRDPQKLLATLNSNVSLQNGGVEARNKKVNSLFEMQQAQKRGEVNFATMRLFEGKCLVPPRERN